MGNPSFHDVQVLSGSGVRLICESSPSPRVIWFLSLSVLWGSSCSTAVEHTHLKREVMGLIPAGCCLFLSFSVLSNVYLNRSLEEVQQYCFPMKNESLAMQFGPNKLTVWNLKKVGLVLIRIFQIAWKKKNVSSAEKRALGEKIVACKGRTKIGRVGALQPFSAF